MKKIIFLSLSVLFTNFLFAQGGYVTLTNSPIEVEVGIANTFTFKFNPSPPTLLPPRVTSTYSLSYWTITAPVSGGTINGNINGYPSSYIYNQSANTNVSASSPSVITATITFGDSAPRLSSITPIAVGSYKDDLGSYAGTIGASGPYAVIVHTIKAPTILPATILDCCTANVQICASDYGDADSFVWSITNGTIAAGQGTSCISVTPNASGNLTATCIVKRSTGLASYTATNTKSIIRTTRTASFTPNYSTTPPYNYICKGSGGLQMNMPTQCGISSINWVAPNCTIVGQNTLTPTITPNSTIPTGSVIDISAQVSFTGGCSTTPSVSFKILDSTTAPTPQGYFTATPSNGGSICTAEIFDLSFISTNGFNNGITTVSPEFLWGPGDPIHYKNGSPTTVTVKNINLCTGLSTSKTFSVYPPAPCASNAKVASTGKLVTSAKVESTEILSNSLVITPNPTNGIIKAMLPDTYSGNYQIFDINGVLVQEAKFDNQTELQIKLSQKLKSGVYVLKVITKTSFALVD